MHTRVLGLPLPQTCLLGHADVDGVPVKGLRERHLQETAKFNPNVRRTGARIVADVFERTNNHNPTQDGPGISEEGLDPVGRLWAS